MPVTDRKGTTYQFPDNPLDVTLMGVSVVNLDLLEVFVAPDGWGRILTRRPWGQPDLVNTPPLPFKRWVDGQWRNYMTWGWVVVTPRP